MKKLLYLLIKFYYYKYLLNLNLQKNFQIDLQLILNQFYI
nr:MAG TPA: hypothetical protein [Caudoviricetes sp.]